MKILLLLLVAALASFSQTLVPVNEANYASTIGAAKGQVVLVAFWATWCVPCRKEMPELVKMAARLDAKGFRLMTVSADEPEAEAAAKKFLAASGVKGASYWRKAKDDDKFIALVDVKWSGALPALFLYDRKGNKVKAWFGETPLSVVEAEVGKRLIGN